MLRKYQNASGETAPVVEKLPVSLDLDPLSPLPQDDRLLVRVSGTSQNSVRGQSGSLSPVNLPECQSSLRWHSVTEARPSPPLARVDKRTNGS